MSAGTVGGVVVSSFDMAVAFLVFPVVWWCGEVAAARAHQEYARGGRLSPS